MKAILQKNQPGKYFPVLSKKNRNLKEKSQQSGVGRAQGRGIEGLEKWAGGMLLGDVNVLKLNCGDGYTTL